MAATAQAFLVDDFELEFAPDPAPAVAVDPAREDAYWARVYQGESYYRAGCDFEDYAPAYCVGYVGYAQYGGNFGDAETSLCANWVRIKGDSRLSLEDAMPAIRAAWERAERAGSEPSRMGRLYAVAPAQPRWRQAANQSIG